MTLATEPPDTPATEEHAHASPHERWAENERMRHVPALSWIVPKLDSDLRRRIDLLWNACANVAPEHPLHNTIDHEFRGLCRSIERIGDVVRRARLNHHHPPAEIGARLRWTMNHTISMLSSVDSATLESSGFSEDYGRYRLVNQFFKLDGTRVARVTTHGLWLNLDTRKPLVPPDDLRKVIEQIFRTEDYEVLSQRR